MSNCKYCGQGAGLLRFKHKECEKKHISGLEQISSLIRNTVINRVKLEKIDTEVKAIAKRCFVTYPEIHQRYKMAYKIRSKIVISNPEFNNVIVSSWMEDDMNIAIGKSKDFCGKGCRATVYVDDKIVSEYEG